MHVRAATTALLAAAVAVVIAGCGGAGPAGSGRLDSAPAKAAVTGVVVQTDTSHPHGGKARPGSRWGSTCSPSMPAARSRSIRLPIATVTTDANGRFRFTGLRPGKRYFVFALGCARLFDGTLDQPGGHVRLVACSDCAIPM